MKGNTINETAAEYLSFLWEQLQYDWSWMSNPWMFYTVIPVLLYFLFFILKWTVLLAPITIPIVLLKWPQNKKEKFSNEFFKKN